MLSDEVSPTITTFTDVTIITWTEVYPTSEEGSGERARDFVSLPESSTTHPNLSSSRPDTPLTVIAGTLITQHPTTSMSRAPANTPLYGSEKPHPLTTESSSTPRIQIPSTRLQPRLQTPLQAPTATPVYPTLTTRKSTTTTLASSTTTPQPTTHQSLSTPGEGVGAHVSPLIIVVLVVCGGVFLGLVIAAAVLKHKGYYQLWFDNWGLHRREAVVPRLEMTDFTLVGSSPVRARPARPARGARPHLPSPAPSSRSLAASLYWAEEMVSRRRASGSFIDTDSESTPTPQQALLSPIRTRSMSSLPSRSDIAPPQHSPPAQRAAIMEEVEGAAASLLPLYASSPTLHTEPAIIVHRTVEGLRPQVRPEPVPPRMTRRTARALAWELGVSVDDVLTPREG